MLTVATPDLVVERTATNARDEPALADLVRATNLPGALTIDLKGSATQLDLHVARGACPRGVTTPATEPCAGPRRRTCRRASSASTHRDKQA